MFYFGLSCSSPRSRATTPTVAAAPPQHPLPQASIALPRPPTPSRGNPLHHLLVRPRQPSLWPSLLGAASATLCRKRRETLAVNFCFSHPLLLSHPSCLVITQHHSPLSLVITQHHPPPLPELPPPISTNFLHPISFRPPQQP